MKVRYILFAVFGSLILALALALALLYYLFAERPACTHDNLTYFSAEEPACDKEGYVEHWHCEDCGRDFADSNAVNEIDKLEVPAAHKPKYSPGKQPTCFTSGYKEFWMCSVCGQTFADEACTQPIGGMVEIPPAHTYTYEFNYIEHWLKCTVCGHTEGLSGHGMMGPLCVDCNFSAVDSAKMTFCPTDGGNAYVVGRGVEEVADIVVPATYNGKPVIGVADHGFEDCDWLKSITLPESITSVGEYAFYECDGLQELTIPENVKTFGAYAFGEMYSLSSVQYNAVAADDLTSGASLFVNCGHNADSFTFTFGDKVQRIPACLFSADTDFLVDNIRISEVNLGAGIVSIGEGAFEGVTRLGRVNVPLGSSLEKIEKRAFAGCEGLSMFGTVNCRNLKSIGEKAFEGCTRLEEFVVPQSVEFIGRRAFGGFEGRLIFERSEGWSCHIISPAEEYREIDPSVLADPFAAAQYVKDLGYDMVNSASA